MINTKQTELRDYVTKKPQKYENMTQINEKIINIIHSFSQNNPPNLSYLKDYVLYQKTYNPKVIVAFLNHYTKIDHNQIKYLIEIISTIAINNIDLLKLIVPILAGKGYVLSQDNMNDFMNKFGESNKLQDASGINNFCNVCIYFINVLSDLSSNRNGINAVDSTSTVYSNDNPKKFLIEFLMFNTVFHHNIKNSDNLEKWKKIIIDIMTKCGCLTMYQPRHEDLIISYKKMLYTTIMILQEHYHLKPDDSCLEALVNTDIVTGIELIIDLIKKYGIRPNASQMQILMAMGYKCDDMIYQLINNHLFDINMYSQVINKNFDNIDKTDTIKKLISVGYQVNQKNLELACKSSSLQVIRMLIEELNIK